jgi:sulfonate transport system ATP-binding protein
MRSGRIAASFHPNHYAPQTLRPILLDELGVQPD